MNNSFIKRIKRYTENMLDNVSWGSKGRKSRVIKPMRVLGKSRIFLGERVMILNQARLETVREWGDKELNGQLLIGNGTSFEQCCHVVAADRVEIGDGCVFSAFVYISDCAHGYSANTGIMDANLVVKPVKSDTITDDHNFVQQCCIVL